jgi:hypothetical protein
LTYVFDNQTIINITNNNVVDGKYKLGYFWTNGSAIKCKQIPIYIDSYNLNISECTYDSKIGVNVLDINDIEKVLNQYNLLMASVNDTTGISRPNYYHINKTDINIPYNAILYEEYTFAVYLKEFLQNETIINPGEDISLKVDIQNINPALPVDVRIEVKLVSLFNENWIIAESASQTKSIPRLGEPAGDTKTFEMALTIPELGNDNVWKGVNSPIRKGGAKSIVSIFIEDKLAGFYESDDYSLLINQTEDQFEGQIIALKHVNNVTGGSIIRGFERNESLYLPDNTTFIVNIYDQYYISSYDQFLERFSFKIDSTFSEIEINPTEIIYGKAFEITALLLSELGDELSGKAVDCQYYNDGTWINIGTDTSEMEGNVSFTINTLQIQNIKNDMTFRLNWAGDQYILSQNENFSVYITLQS